MKKAVKVISLLAAVFATASIFTSSAFAWDSEMHVGSSVTPAVCNSQTGEFGDFQVTYTASGENYDGWTFVGTDPTSPVNTSHPSTEAGQTKSQTFTFKWEKYYSQDVYEWVVDVPGHWKEIDHWPWKKWVDTTYKKVKTHSKGDVKDTYTESKTAYIKLPKLGDCLQEVTTVTPEFTAPTCDSEGAVTLPKTEGVEYGISQSGDVVTVTAAAEKGYVLSEGSQTEWTFNVGKLNCPKPPPPHQCEYTGAGKDGQLDANGGHNDDCAPLPQPPVVKTPPTVVPPVVVPPTPETCVASTKTQKKSVTQRFVRFIRTITWTKTTTVNTDCSKTVNVKRAVKKVAVKRAVARPKPQKPVKLPKPDKPVKAPKTL